MGYMTNYTLKWEETVRYKQKKMCEHKMPDNANYCPVCGKPNEYKDINTEIGKYIKADENMRYAVGEDGESGQECKWYDHQEDMKKMSNHFEGILFELHGEGEEAGDLWNEYYLSGKMQLCKAKIIYPEYNMKELR